MKISEMLHIILPMLCFGFLLYSSRETEIAEFANLDSGRFVHKNGYDFVISNPPKNKDSLLSLVYKNFQSLALKDKIDKYRYYGHSYYKETWFTHRYLRSEDLRHCRKDILITISIDLKFNEQTITFFKEGKSEKVIEKIWREDCPSLGGQYLTESSRYEQKYREVKIGNLVWMAENLNYKTGNSWCYDNDESNCKKYGRLYDWNTAMRACPGGWHLPSSAEWEDLVKTVDDSLLASKKLKSKKQWNGTDDYGWAALPGGKYNFYDGDFGKVGEAGIWWSSTTNEGGFALNNSMDSHYYSIHGRYIDHRCNGYSVRCVKD
jgi:uncharacterized protein (TIGR02145 family)